MEIQSIEYQQNPVILNQPGVRFWIVARTGKTARGTFRQYLCSSEKRLACFGVDDLEGHAEPEDGVRWMITQVVPIPPRDAAGWASFSQYYITIHNGPDGPWNVWHVLYRAVRGTFSTGSRVWIGASVPGRPNP